ncbi:MAG: hypothetical protein HYW85_02060, partial [Deltaproteobacteria bacterium]|nr:hypothetical protein [Deltaproteobacteria bacterium]
MKQRLLMLGSLCCYGAALGSEFLFLRPFLDIDFAHLFPYFYFHIFSSLLFALAASFWFKFHIHFFSFFVLSSFCLSVFALIGIPLFLGMSFLLQRQKESFFEEPSEVEEDMSQFLGILPSEKISEDILETVHG